MFNSIKFDNNLNQVHNASKHLFSFQHIFLWYIKLFVDDYLYQVHSASKLVEHFWNLPNSLQRTDVQVVKWCSHCDHDADGNHIGDYHADNDADGNYNGADGNYNGELYNKWCSLGFKCMICRIFLGWTGTKWRCFNVSSFLW